MAFIIIINKLISIINLVGAINRDVVIIGLLLKITLTIPQKVSIKGFELKIWESHYRS